MKIKILHLYPDLLNLYGDRGNIECMRKRLMWRGIDAEVVTYTCEDSGFDLSDVDIVFIGGGSDREQKIVCHRLLEHKNEIRNYVDENETIEGLDILNIYTEQGKKRLIGNIVLENDFLNQKIVGFENHGGRTYIGNHTPLGRVVYGYGNDEKSGVEGVVYKNVVATYLHGPLLPKNPALCDYILTNAIKRKNPYFKGLGGLEDTLEDMANQYIVNRFKK